MRLSNYMVQIQVLIGMYACTLFLLGTLWYSITESSVIKREKIDIYHYKVQMEQASQSLQLLVS